MATVPRRQVHVADGRRLDLYERGPRDGAVLLFHHGTPGSCLPFRAIEHAAHRLGLRFVTTSRPGYGDSTRFPQRQVVDVVADTRAVLEAVGADRCYVAGWSGGGPHALACGARLAEQVDAVLVIAGVAVPPTFAIHSIPARSHAVKLPCDTRDGDLCRLRVSSNAMTSQTNARWSRFMSAMRVNDTKG